MSRLSNLGNRLYTGEVSYDFVGRRNRWYATSLVILLLSVAAVVSQGLDYGIEFEGGAVYTVPTETGTVEQALDVLAAQNVPGEPIVTEAHGADTRFLRIQTEELTGTQSVDVARALAEEFDVPSNEITAQVIGPSWGEEITNKALQGLVIFLILVVIFLSVYFEWRMAVAALVALAHDLVITVGVYALIGFTVTPATVVGFLTILGYSLYDTVVVFDKVKENTRGLSAGSRMTYSEAANMAVNQTLVRSINTSVIALLPVASILFVGAGFLGAETLKDLALVLFVGIAAGTYSSIFVATPLLAQLKEREPTMQALAKRVAARRSAGKDADLVPGRGSSGRAVTTAVLDPETDVDDDSDDVPDVVPPARGSVTPPAAQPPRRQQPARNRSRKGGKKRR